MNLSIVIPFYNCGRYAYENLKSLSEGFNFQDRKNFEYEILVVDDHGNRQDVEIASKTITKLANPNIRIIQPPNNLGISDARNYGIQNASGKHIWCIDADDFVESTLIPSLVKTLMDLEPDLVLLDATWNGPGYRWPMNAFEYEPCTLIDVTSEILASYINTASFYAWRFIAKKSLYQDVSYPSRMYIEDLATGPVLLSKATNIWYEARPVINYRQNALSIMKTWNKQKSIDFIRAISLLDERLRNIGAMDNHPVQYAVQKVAYNCLFWSLKDAVNHKITDLSEAFNTIKKLFEEKFGPISIQQAAKYFIKSNPKRFVGILAIKLGLPIFKYAFLARKSFIRD